MVSKAGRAEDVLEAESGKAIEGIENNNDLLVYSLLLIV